MKKANDKPACGHASLKADCRVCSAFQKAWYDKLGFKDIEYGRDTITLAKNDPALVLKKLLYQPVNVNAVNGDVTAFYDRVWVIYHQWVKENKSKRDCLVCELYAQQSGDTGTNRGIQKILKSKKLKPNGHQSVYKTIKKIKELVAAVDLSENYKENN